MNESLPPELDRLGAVLERATARDARLRARRGERRRRTAAAFVVAALALTVLVPSGLQSGDGRGGLAVLAASSVAYRPMACDRPRGATFVAARPCATPGATDATPGLLARRYAVH